MNAANERINIINVIILEYRVHIDPILLLYFIIKKKQGLFSDI